MTRPTATPGQTVGPFFGYALPYGGGPDRVPTTPPHAVRQHGGVLDGDGQPVPDALLELWQADADGTVAREAGSLHRDGYTFTGWGRAETDAEGRYTFTTVRPGAEPGRAAFFCVTVFARGLLDRLFTRAYLPGHQPEGPLSSLVASEDSHGYRFDIVLTGSAATPLEEEE